MWVSFIEFILPIKKLRIQELLEMVEMTEYAKVKAKDLSGGQQQRVALAKVLRWTRNFVVG
jgi:ABC-type phosphate/phosphonate transport system ATPase subunit